VILEMNFIVLSSGILVRWIENQVLISWLRVLDIVIHFYRVVLGNITMKIIQIWRKVTRKTYLKVIE
jgi:hypothetical protein